MVDLCLDAVIYDAWSIKSGSRSKKEIFLEYSEMATGDESNLIEAVVTCEGNIHDPDFSERFQILLGNLKTLLSKCIYVKFR